MRIQGVSDGDNYGALELWDASGSNKWQFAHKSIAGQTGNFSFAHFDGTSWFTPFTITNTGNVGIGTTGPQNRLHLGSGELRISSAFTGDSFNYFNNGPDSGLQIDNDSDFVGMLLKNEGTDRKDGVVYWGDNLDDNLRFIHATWDGVQHNLNEYMRITGTGNVGIGTTSPGASLHVVSTDTISTAFKVQTGSISGTEVVISTTGKVGIGTTAPSQKLTVVGNIGIQAGANAFIGTLDNYALSLKTYNADRIFITNTGYVGIGTTNPGYTLHVNGDFAVTGAKNFEINHPTKSGKKLVHACIEGPEVAVYYRGEGKLIGGSAIIELPDYFEALTRKEGRTVQLTPKGTKPYLLSASEVKDGKFMVYGTEPDGEFYWEVKAVRADVKPLQVEK